MYLCRDFFGLHIIYYYKKTENAFYYSTGQIGAGMQNKMERASHVRKVKPYEDNPLFYAVKYLSSLVDENELKKLISDTYFWWMYDNFDKYVARLVFSGIFFGKY